MKQLGQLRRDYDKFVEAGAEVLVVFREERAGVKGLQKSEKVNLAKFPLLLDTGSAQTKVYSEKGFDTYIIDKSGNVAAKLDGSKLRRPSSKKLLETLNALSK